MGDIRGAKIGGILRTAGLWVLILADAAMLFWLYATGNMVWFGVFLLITLWIVFAEVYGMICGLPDYQGGHKKMTISTNYKRYIERVGWIGYIPLGLFWLAMTGLVLHLAVW